MTLPTPDRPPADDRRPSVPRGGSAARPTRRGDRLRLGLAVLVTVVCLVVLVATGLAVPDSPEAASPPAPAAPPAPPAPPDPTPDAPATPTDAPTDAPTDEPETQKAPPAAPVAPDLEAQLRTYVKSRPTTAAVEVRDLITGQEYRYRADKRYDSASVVKIAVMAATLRQQERAGRALTGTERSLLGRMIRNSDNDATSTLWNRLGRGTAMDRFFDDAGMTRTKAGPGGYWGLTQITAADQVVLMAHLTQPSDLLGKAGRAYARKLMAGVVDDQDWGVSAGPGTGVTVELKNGWLPRGRRGWAVHSVGHVQGEGRNYLIAVLTLDNGSERKGITTIEGASKLVWRGLAPA